MAVIIKIVAPWSWSQYVTPEDHNLILQLLWSILWVPNTDISHVRSYIFKSHQNSHKDNVKLSGT
jgi:hypothetical protein